MRYVFDSGPLIWMFKYYYPERFPSLWKKFDRLVEDKQIISVKEVSRELDGQEDLLSQWVKSNKSFFQLPVANEFQIVTDIFQIPHFQTLIRKQERLLGKPVADPFVIAKAQSIGGCVITTEKYKENAAQIPNVCERFNIPWMDLERFMKEEDWTF